MVARLREVLQAEGVTLYTAGLTGLALALGRWSGDRDVVIGTNLANRPGAKFEDVVGMFVDPVVLRLTPTEGPDGAPAATVGEALAGVRTRFADALAHSDVPYLDVVQHTASGRRDNSLFSVIATMFDLGQDAEQLPAVAAPAPATSKFPLAVEFLPRPDGLAVHVLYAIDRYLPSTVERALGRIAAFLEALARGGPATPINEFVSGSRPCQERFARFRELLAADPS